jgi:hypothetical protein
MAKRNKSNNDDSYENEQDIEAMRTEMAMLANEIKRMQGVIQVYETRVHSLETKSIVNERGSGTLGTIVPTLGQITFK